MTKFNYQPSALTQGLIFFVLAGLPGIMLLLLSWANNSAFTSKGFWLGLALLVLLASGLVACMRHNWLSISATELTVRSSFYKKTYLLKELKKVCDAPVNLMMLNDYAWKRRRRAFSFPGYHSGHFVLRNGKSAFVSVIALEVLIYEDSKGHYLLLGVPEIEKIQSLLDAIKTA
ncbi:MAG: hypothetical protein RLZZ502_94 [Pseudomonadota bacterium]|jgi:hypothetical protein